IVLGAGTVVHRSGKMLVVRRARDPHRGLWAFPGGRVEAGESPSEAALRETKEEVGLDVEIEGIFDVVTYLPGRRFAGMSGRPPKSQVVIVDYLAKPSRGRVVLNDESSDFMWVLPGELLRLRTTPQMKACALRFEELRVY
ncbi:MAG: NUDIX domain-containing protein, partial [Nitrososphaerota archaeon]|nr:NUDIX domain-containing protein [Nitrososphaerota archaeon]